MLHAEVTAIRTSLKLLIAVIGILLILLVALQLFTGLVIIHESTIGPSRTIQHSKADNLFIKGVTITVPGCDEAWIEKHSCYHQVWLFGQDWMSWRTIKPGFVLAVRLNSSLDWSQTPKYNGHNLPQLNSVAHCGFAAIEQIDASLFSISPDK